MKLKELQEAIDKMNEMALRNTELIGDFTKDGSFYGPDRKIHLGKNRISQLKHFFKNTEVDFTIIFANVPNKTPIYSISYDKNFERLLSDLEFIGLDDEEVYKCYKAFSKDTINVVFTNNDGTEAVPMSPWIVAHRISHVIFHDEENYMSILSDIMPALISAFRGSYTGVYENPNFTNESEIFEQRPAFLPELAHAFGTMTSATTNKLHRGGEFVHELFAQYILDGTVTLKKKGLTNSKENDFGVVFVVKDKPDLNKIRKAEQVINSVFSKVIQEAKGNYYKL